MDLSQVPEPLRSRIAEQLQRLPPEVRSKMEQQLGKLPLNQLEAVLKKTSPLLDRLAATRAGAAHHRKGSSNIALPASAMAWGSTAPKPARSRLPRRRRR
jgi:hypothetical protein